MLLIVALHYGTVTAIGEMPLHAMTKAAALLPFCRFWKAPFLQWCVVGGDRDFSQFILRFPPLKGPSTNQTGGGGGGGQPPYPRPPGKGLTRNTDSPASEVGV